MGSFYGCCRDWQHPNQPENLRYVWVKCHRHVGRSGFNCCRCMPHSLPFSFPRSKPPGESYVVTLGPQRSDFLNAYLNKRFDWEIVLPCFKGPLTLTRLRPASASVYASSLHHKPCHRVKSQKLLDV